jgi:hypothetical protein
MRFVLSSYVGAVLGDFIGSCLYYLKAVALRLLLLLLLPFLLSGLRTSILTQGISGFVFQHPFSRLYKKKELFPDVH